MALLGQDMRQHVDSILKAGLRIACHALTLAPVWETRSAAFQLQLDVLKQHIVHSASLTEEVLIENEVQAALIPNKRVGFVDDESEAQNEAVEEINLGSAAAHAAPA
ncbi:hypothetical protein HDU86_005935 [Geranomyces michiganensis]|nr:hypothetical protein HDU86_005935 [Geranomyces michiganensis]